jgi:hypothetical protein
MQLQVNLTLTIEEINMNKTFNIAGYSKLSGQYKARFANGTVAERTRVLKRDNHADIYLVELPQAMSKSEAAQFVLSGLTAVEPAVGVALKRIIEKDGAVSQPVTGKIAAPVSKAPAAKAIVAKVEASA